ncbi:hypothetical protein KCU64_g31, partial [Aureobasidium melanogenum]
MAGQNSNGCVLDGDLPGGDWLLQGVSFARSISDRCVRLDRGQRESLRPVLRAVASEREPEGGLLVEIRTLKPIRLFFWVGHRDAVAAVDYSHGRQRTQVLASIDRHWGTERLNRWRCAQAREPTHSEIRTVVPHIPHPSSSTGTRPADSMKRIYSRQLEAVQYERHRASTAVFQKVIKEPRPRPRARFDDFTILIGDSSPSSAAMLLEDSNTESRTGVEETRNDECMSSPG